MTTVLDLAIYFLRHILSGRGAWNVEVDWRSLICSSNICQYNGIRPSPPAHMIDAARKVVLIDAVLEK